MEIRKPDNYKHIIFLKRECSFKEKKMKKAIFFDRDGTIIKHIHYLSNPNEVELIPGVKKILSFLKWKNYVRKYK